MTTRRWALAMAGFLWSLAAGPARCAPAPPALAGLKVGVRETGLYRLSAADMGAAGAPVREIDPRTLRLARGGQEVAILVTGEADGRLDPGDAIEFFGTALDTRFTDTNVYRLSWGAGPGRRWRSAGLVLPPQAPPTSGGLGGRDPATTYRERLRLEENHLYGKLLFAAAPGDIPHWFWAEVLPKAPWETRFRTDAVAAGAGAVRLTLLFWGNTTLPGVDPDHHVRVVLNGHPVDDARWDGQTERRLSVEVPAEWLDGGGENRLAVECPGDTGAGELDRVYVDWLEVEYGRDLAARDGTLLFDAPAGARSVRVAGIADPEARVLDVSEPLAVARLPATLEPGGLRFAVGPGAAARCLAASPGRALRPAWIAPLAPTSLRDTIRGADYLAIAPAALAPAVAPLAEWRRKQGLRVEVVTVEEVYDAFSDGVFTPEAIRDFVLYTSEHWRKPAPRFLLLVGDASHDYRDYLGTGRRNQVPAHLVRIPGSMEAPTDDWFACAPSDGCTPRMFVGRFPADRPEEVATLVAKTLRYEQQPPAPWQRRALVVADHDRADDQPTGYERVCDRIVEICRGGGLETTQLNLRQAGLSAAPFSDARRAQARQAVTPRIVAEINRGCLLVEFQGHGAVDYWSRERILEPGDVARLNNRDGPAIFLDISCFTGAFDYPDAPDGECLAEKLLLHPEGGAVACVAAARLGGWNVDVPFVRALAAGERPTLGELLWVSKRFLAASGTGFWSPVANYNLLGDPALRIPVTRPNP